jgi:hypothetical protein
MEAGPRRVLRERIPIVTDVHRGTVRVTDEPRDARGEIIGRPERVTGV